MHKGRGRLKASAAHLLPSECLSAGESDMYVRRKADEKPMRNLTDPQLSKP
jgi:hypothetical protein